MNSQTDRDDCSRIDRWVSLRLDGELGESQSKALDAHLASCAECRRRSQAWSQWNVALTTELEQLQDSLEGALRGRLTAASLPARLPQRDSLGSAIPERANSVSKVGVVVARQMNGAGAPTRNANVASPGKRVLGKERGLGRDESNSSGRPALQLWGSAAAALVVALTAWVFMNPTSPVAPQPVARAEWSGTGVWFTDAAGRERMIAGSEGRDLFGGERILVPENVSCKVVFEDGTAVQIGEESEFLVLQGEPGKAEVVGSVLELVHGAATFDVTPQEECFRVMTPCAEVVVVGTQFTVIHARFDRYGRLARNSGDGRIRSEVEVTEGVVRVSRRVGSELLVRRHGELVREEFLGGGTEYSLTAGESLRIHEQTMVYKPVVDSAFDVTLPGNVSETSLDASPLDASPAVPSNRKPTEGAGSTNSNSAPQSPGAGANGASNTSGAAGRNLDLPRDN